MASETVTGEVEWMAGVRDGSWFKALAAAGNTREQAERHVELLRTVDPDAGWGLIAMVVPDGK